MHVQKLWQIIWKTNHSQDQQMMMIERKSGYT